MLLVDPSQYRDNLLGIKLAHQTIIPILHRIEHLYALVISGGGTAWDTLQGHTYVVQQASEEHPAQIGLKLVTNR